MGEYFAKMPFQGIPGPDGVSQPVRVTTYEPQPPHHGWTANVQSISPPLFELLIGHDQQHTDEAMLLHELTLYYGLSQA